MEEKDVIRVEGLTKYYGDLCAVDHIDFDLRKGEILGLLGPKGATRSGFQPKLSGSMPAALERRPFGFGAMIQAGRASTQTWRIGQPGKSLRFLVRECTIVMMA